MRRVLLACLASAVALLVGATSLAVPQALAVGAYSIDELSTQVTVEPNATTHIVERQTLTFSDNNAGVVWYLHVPEDKESVRIANVRVAPVDDGGTLLGDWTRLQMTDSNPDRQGRNPGDTAAAQLRTTKTQPWYSYNIGDGMVRCYFPTGKMAATATTSAATSASDQSEDTSEDSPDDDSSDAAADDEAPADSAPDSAPAAVAVPDSEIVDHHTYLIETDYTISHRVRVYRDVAELYWRYVNDSLPTDASNVNLQVTLPLPAEADPIAAASEVTAWGHGPSDGTFAVGENGSVTYHLDHIAQGSYAEAHLIFPASWENALSPNGANQFSELRRASAAAEEAQWVDVRQREAAWDANVRMLFLAVAMPIVLIALVNVIRHGRTPRARRTLVRAAATAAIVALGAQLFFREPATTTALAILAAAFALASLALPATEPEGASSEFEPSMSDALGESEAPGATDELEVPDTSGVADELSERDQSAASEAADGESITDPGATT